MRGASFWSEIGHRALRALVGLAFLTTLACDNSMNFNPAAPEWPDWSQGVPGTRTLEIQGTLGIEDGAVLEATVLYDGLEVAGARSSCPRPAGCGELELEASVVSATGNHTISFLVLRQSREISDYHAEGTVRVSRENVNLGGVPLRLGPTQASLEAGQAVTFEIQFSN
jgi:hypothetical protein